MSRGEKILLALEIAVPFVCTAAALSVLFTLLFLFG